MGLFSRGTGTVPNGYDATLPDNSSYASKVINGQLVPVFTTRGMFPSQAAAPYMYGNGSKPATLAGFSPGMGISSSLAVGGGPSSDDESPWNPRVSPVPWALAFLVVGMIGLRQIHWRAE